MHEYINIYKVITFFYDGKMSYSQLCKRSCVLGGGGRGKRGGKT